jgi:hypothetical protein
LVQSELEDRLREREELSRRTLTVDAEIQLLERLLARANA